ncbi:MAG: Uma2 family endonuclease [Okeania sp. SIO2C9]|nr:Uma2 family endonuclease [Okeania sp. SIO2C9]
MVFFKPKSLKSLYSKLLRLLNFYFPTTLFLIVEVADSTIKFDREVKIPLYAENNVIEVWLVDINGECLEVYRQPIGSSYKEVQKLERGEIFSIQRFPDINIQVDEILG